MVKRIGIFGGTFDPIHIGHLRCALEVAQAYQLDELRLVPNAVPPHRATPHVSAKQRLQMVRLAIEGEPLLTVDDREIRRSTPSWTIDTLLSLRQEIGPQDQLIFIFGWDAFCTVMSWHRWTEFLNYCHFLVLQRPDLKAEAPQQLKALIDDKCIQAGQRLTGAAGQIAFMAQTPLAISATHIRCLLAARQNIRFLVPERVLTYITEQGLYQLCTEQKAEHS